MIWCRLSNRRFGGVGLLRGEMCVCRMMMRVLSGRRRRLLLLVSRRRCIEQRLRGGRCVLRRWLSWCNVAKH